MARFVGIMNEEEDDKKKRPLLMHKNNYSMSIKVFFLEV